MERERAIPYYCYQSKASFGCSYGTSLTLFAHPPKGTLNMTRIHTHTHGILFVKLVHSL